MEFKFPSPGPHSKLDPVIFFQIFVAVVLIAGVYFGGQYWKSYKTEKAQVLAEVRQEKEALEEEKLAEEALDRLRDEQIIALKEQLEELKNKPAEIKTVNVPTVDTTVSLVKEWNPRVAKIECTWAYTNGTPYARGAGSATIVAHDGIIKAVTSKHVLLYQDQFGPRDCKLALSTGAVYTVPNNFEDNYFVGTSEDWGFIRLNPDKTLNAIANKTVKICRDVDLGDRVLILGYPGIGSDIGLTVTEGIVSGLDGNYFITSAKIDKGNSGGAAILAKDGCYLGIPTASVVGIIESLGRVLKASFVME